MYTYSVQDSTFQPQNQQNQASSMPQGGYQQPQMTEYFPGVPKPDPEQVVYAWEAPSRPFQEKSRQFYTTVITIATLISLILFFAGQILPIAVIVAVVFLFYVMSTIPPTQVLTRFTNYGIRYEEQLYFWEELGNFWTDETHGQRMIHVEIGRFPNRLTLMIGQGDEDLIVDMLSEVLPFQKPVPTTYERAAEWLAKKIPLELDKQKPPTTPATPAS